MDPIYRVQERRKMSYSPSLAYLKEQRNMPWISRGMWVVVDGKEGHVAGSYGGNVAVKFLDVKYTSNCHPFWRAIYYNDDGTVVRNYYENQSWVADGRDHEVFSSSQ